jgi:hypothetical protein
MTQTIDQDQSLPPTQTEHIERVVLAFFLLTFIASRVLVILIEARLMPDLYLHLGKQSTHVHHLNYGIFLLSAVGAYLLFRRPGGRRLTMAAIVYAVGLGLTFDEFGMWLHLGGPYWNRNSFDAVIVIAAFLAFTAYAPSIRQFRPRHWFWTILVTGAVVLFFVLLIRPVQERWLPKAAEYLHQIENSGPT